eukprot:2953624-Pyramimonas_sp.AAC.1
MEVSRCWDISVDKFSKTKHWWQCVRGPLAATVAVLLDLNALPHSPVHWIFLNGVHIRSSDQATPHTLWSTLME